MRRLLTDVCVSAAFVADLFATALAEAARRAQAGRPGWCDRPGPGPADRIGGRARRVIDIGDGPPARTGSYWFR